VQLRVQQDQLAAQLQSQQARLGPSHPEAESLRRQLAEAQRAVSAEIARVVAATTSDRRSAAERVATLEHNLRNTQDEADRGAQAQVALNAMQRDAEASRAQLQAVLERIQQTAQQAAIETSEAREISQALPPEHPSWPRTGPMMAAACLSGVFLGLLLVYVLHLADTSFHSGEDIRAFAGLPCFALLPEAGRRALGHHSIEDYVARRPLTAFAEQVRALRAGLWFGANRPRVIATTAARPAEGKTVVTIALGRSASLAGERVLLIESDLRQPRFAPRLHAKGTQGLADLLRGEATLEDVIQQDALSDMHFIHAGRVSIGAGRGGDLVGLFMSETMARLLAKVRLDYDLVLLDAPPVQAMTEARVVAAIADATLLCVRWRSTPRDVLRHALELLEDAHANVVGAVLTRVDPRVHVRSGSADSEVYHRRYQRYYRG
jgi:capsular exopolysaccharide synthesis family protein